MADIKGFVEVLDITAQDIGTAIDELKAARQVHRGYMGLSQVGLVNECPRKAWFMMHGHKGKDFPGRILRLFRTGDNVEFDVVTDLKDVGLTVYGEQYYVEATRGGDKFTGHTDGFIKGLDFLALGKKTCLLEIKSCNDRRFKELKKSMDYCLWGGAAYEAQVHIYATLAKVDRILTVVENKDTSERIFLRFNRRRDFAIKTLNKAFDIMEMVQPPAPSFPPTFYKCKWCDYAEMCRS